MGKVTGEWTGQTKSLGIFFWATDSDINHDPRFPNRLLSEDNVNASAIASSDE